MKERLLYLDYVKAIAIILVIMGHVNFANHEIKAWVYAFHMPVFFFVTGYVLRVEKLNIVIKKYFMRLMVPYLLWAIIFAKFSIPNFAMILYGSYSSISQSGALTSLWFLPVMFIAILLFIITKRLLDIIRMDKQFLLLLIGMISFCVGVSLPKIRYGYVWSINVSLVAYAFLLVGSILRVHFARLFDLLKKNRDTGFSVCILLSLLFFAGTMVCSYNIPEKGYVLMGNARYGNPLMFLISSICGIIMLFFLCVMLELIIPKGVRFLSFVGQNTLCIFFVQKPIIHLFGFLSRSFHLPAFFVLILVTICTLLVSCLVCLFFNKYFPVFVGKEKVFSKQ